VRVPALLTKSLAPLLLVLLACSFVGVHATQNEELSPFDEWVYVDYLYKVPTEGVVRQGEETGEEAREAISCLGVAITLPAQPALCAQVEAGTETGDQFPQQGLQSADIYTPAYFVATYALAQPFLWAGVDSLLDAGTYVGAVWLALGAVLLYASLRRVRVPRLTSFALSAVTTVAPPLFWATTYVSTDAPSLAVGAGLLYLGLRLATGGRWPVAALFVLLSVVGVLLKLQNIVAVGLVALFLLARAVTLAAGEREQDRTARGVVLRVVRDRGTVAAVSAVVLSVVGQGAWIVVRGLLSVGPSPDQGTAAPFGVRELVDEAFRFLPATAQDNTGTLGTALSLAGTLLSLLVIAGVLGLLFSAPRASLEQALAGASLVAVLVAGPLLAVGVVAVTGYYFPLPARYGLVLIPALVTCSGILASRWRGTGPVLAVVLLPVAVGAAIVA